MQLIAVSYWPDRRASLPSDWEVWETRLSIPETYSQIAAHAVSQGWDRDVVVIQDDTRLDSIPPSDAELIVYGKGNEDHVCPRAFAASPEVWKVLARRWQPWTGQICRTWKPAVDEFGEVLNVTRQEG